MPDPETNIDWVQQIALIRWRFESALRAGETIDGMDTWLAQVPEEVREELREALEQCHSEVFKDSIDTRILSSDAALGRVAMASGPETADVLTSKQAVRDCQTFQGLSSAAGTALQQRFEPQSFPKGTQLLQQGQPARGLHLILNGDVDIVDTETCERIACDGAGSVMGEMSLLTDQPCSADVVATSDVEALVLSAEGYHQLIAAHPELEIAISQLVSDRLGGRRHDALCGKTIGDYQLTRCINRGGMGVVYEAKHIGDGDRVALKMLRHRFIYDDQMKSRFDQEASLLAKLRHPNIVTFREHFLAYRTRFLVLDLCDGADLYRLLRARGPMDEATVRKILGQIAAGLLHAHKAGVIHRDLKPGNVLVERNGQVRLTDFGLSKLLESELPEGKAVGTPSYMPPEQFRDGDAGPHCDFYALGCLLCEMLTGEILFPTGTWVQIFQAKRQTAPSDDWPDIDVSGELREIIHGTLQPNPRDRHLDLEKLSHWSEQPEGLFGPE